MPAGPRTFGWHREDGTPSNLDVHAGSDTRVMRFTSATAAVNGTLAVSSTSSFTGLVTFATKITAELGIFDAGLILDSTSAMTFQIGGTDILALDDSAITLVAANTVAGQDLFLQTEDGGVVSSAVGVVGGLLDLRSGDGSAGNGGTNIGGAGANIVLQAGAGGAGVSTADGADGGAISITAGNAVDTSGGTNDGVGGGITLTCGTSSANGTGAAGDLTFVVNALTFTWPLTDGNSGDQLATDGSSPSAMTWTANTSVREAKQDIVERSDVHGALQTIVGTPVYDFHYREGKGTGDTETNYVGIMADEAPWAMHHKGRTVSPVNTLGYMVLALRAVTERLEALEA